MKRFSIFGLAFAFAALVVFSAVSCGGSGVTVNGDPNSSEEWELVNALSSKDAPERLLIRYPGAKVVFSEYESTVYDDTGAFVWGVVDNDTLIETWGSGGSSLWHVPASAEFTPLFRMQWVKEVSAKVHVKEKNIGCCAYQETKVTYHLAFFEYSEGAWVQIDTQKESLSTYDGIRIDPLFMPVPEDDRSVCVAPSELQGLFQDVGARNDPQPRYVRLYYNAIEPMSFCSPE